MIRSRLLQLFMVGVLLFGLMGNSQPVSSYTPCVGAEDGDTVNMHYEVSQDGPMFDTSYGGDPLVVVLSPDNLIQGFYEGVLGMKIGDRKLIEVPPEKGYTQEGHEFYGKTLFFDVILNNVTDGYSSVCASDPNASDPLNTSDAPDFDLPYLGLPMVLTSLALVVTTYRRRR